MGRGRITRKRRVEQYLRNQRNGEYVRTHPVPTSTSPSVQTQYIGAAMIDGIHQGAALVDKILKFQAQRDTRTENQSLYRKQLRVYRETQQQRRREIVAYQRLLMRDRSYAKSHKYYTTSDTYGWEEYDDEI